jgi:putative ABC transport system ATP-binding protein
MAPAFDPSAGQSSRDAVGGRTLANPKEESEVVSLVGVTKSFARGGSTVRVLDGCTLSARQGECVFLMGPSGSGKSTLLSIIGCLLSADAGQVSIMGRDVGQTNVQANSALRLAHIGFVFQRFHLIRGLSALENVCMPLVLAGVVPSKSRCRGLELLEQVGLADKAHCDPRRLSVGQCQRVALARALAADPPLILADEPTASLDAQLGQQAMQLLRDLTVERQKTAIVVTHDARIEHFADRVLVLENGRLRERAA